MLLLIVLSLFISGCPGKNDKFYPLAEEIYMMSWILRDINDSTPTVLEYKPEELSKYNYSYGFPGGLPLYYQGINSWVAPFESFVINSFMDFSAPSNRIHYLRADNALELGYGRDWSFSNMMYINLKNSDDEIERNIYNDMHKEHYRSENIFYGINPVPGEEVNVFFGTAPFIPTSVSTWHNTIFLKYPLLRGYNGNSYLSRTVKTSYQTNEGELVFLHIPTPWFKIYRNNMIVKEGNLTTYNSYVWSRYALSYNAYDEGHYKIVVDIPSGYPLFNTTRITTEFYKDSDVVNLPILNKIEFPPSFSEGDNLSISIEFENQESIEDIKLYVKRNIDTEWNIISTGTEASFKVEGDTNSIDFMFTARTLEGNVTYEMSTVSLKKKDIVCSIIIDDISGETILIGSCKDGIKNASNIRLDVIGDNLKIGSMITNNKGDFLFSTPGEYENIKVKFDGTGVYTQKEFIPTSVPEHCNNRLMDFDEKGYDCSGSDCLPCSFFPNLYVSLYNQPLIIGENNFINFTIHKSGTGKVGDTKATLYLYDPQNREYIYLNNYDSGDMIERQLRDSTKINLTFDIVDKRNINITFEFNGKKINEIVYSGKVFMLDDKYLVIVERMRNEENEGNYIGKWIDIYIINEFEEFIKAIDDFEEGIRYENKNDYFEYFLREKKNLYGTLYIQNEEDVNLENNIRRVRYTILNRDADVDVRFYTYGQFFFIDDNISVNLEIKNLGFTVAEDVNYTIYLNDTPVLRKTIGNLSYKNYTLYINDIFVAETEGIFNATVVVESSNDVNLSNNIGARQIEVKKGKDVRFNISVDNEPFIGRYYIYPVSYWMKEEDEGILDAKVAVDENINYISKDYSSSKGDNYLQYSIHINHRDVNVDSYDTDRGGVNTSGRIDNNIFAYFTVWNKVSFDFDRNIIYINIRNSSKLSMDLDESKFFYCSEWNIDGYTCNGNWTEGNSYITLYDNVRLYINSGQTKSEAYTLGAYCDNDGDGYTTLEECTNSDLILGDCDDNDENMGPGTNEVCDGIDNDCDGDIDEDLTKESSCGVGQCSGNVGAETCSEGEWTDDTCDPFEGASTEICDGIDNDCDGVIDSITKACGIGFCAGTEICSAGNWGDCSSKDNDGGVCAKCDAEGIPVYDDTQDTDCGVKNCDDLNDNYPDYGDGCYAYNDGCEERDYTDKAKTCIGIGTCSNPSCGSHIVSNQHTDYDGSDYCDAVDGDVFKTHYDYACSGSSCQATTSEVFVKDCGESSCDGDWSNPKCSADASYVASYQTCYKRRCQNNACSTRKFISTDDDHHKDCEGHGCWRTNYVDACAPEPSPEPEPEPGKVICTELYQKGLMDEETYKMDVEYAVNHFSKEAIKGYQAWAIPVVKNMRKSSEFEESVRSLVDAFMEEIAYRTGKRETGNEAGKLLLDKGVPLFERIGVHISKPNWRVLFDESWLEEKVDPIYAKMIESKTGNKFFPILNLITGFFESKEDSKYNKLVRNYFTEERVREMFYDNLDKENKTEIEVAHALIEILGKAVEEIELLIKNEGFGTPKSDDEAHDIEI